MSKTSHVTIGPWRVEERWQRDPDIYIVADSPDGTVIAHIRTQDIRHVHLIAVAPELLEALIDLEDAASGLEAEIDDAGDDRLPSGCDTRGALIAARRAIAKATGKEH